MNLKTYHAGGALAKEIPIAYITPPKKSPNGLYTTCKVYLSSGRCVELEPSHLDRYYPGWRELIKEEITR